MGTRQGERGQALVLIILAITGMMGFAALAIDGGMVMAERRRAQNAADAAAYAVALAAVEGKTATQMQSIADNVLSANGFRPGTDVAIQISHGPNSGPYQGRAGYYQVIIHMVIKPMFSQFVFSGGLPTTTEAVARAKGGKSTNGGGGNAVHGLGKAQNGETSVRFNGSVTVQVISGNIYGRFDGDKDGGNSSNEKTGIFMYPGTDINISGGWSGTYGGIYSGSPGSATTYTPQVSQLIQDDPTIIEPSCGNKNGYSETVTVGEGKDAKQVVRFYPGNYKNELRYNGGTDVEFQKGVYCLYNGISVNGGANVTGLGVLFVVKSGTISINGNGEITMRAPYDGDGVRDAKGQIFDGLMLYSSSQGDVVLTGSSKATFSGTVYAPYSTCEYGGNGYVYYQSNTICNYVWTHGTADVIIDYKPEENFPVDTQATIDLMQ